jgi:hypothetical protein
VFRKLLNAANRTIGPRFRIEFDEIQGVLVFHSVMHRKKGYNHFIWCEISDILRSDHVLLVVNFGVYSRSRSFSARRRLFLRCGNNTRRGYILLKQLAVFPVKDLVLNATVKIPILYAFKNLLCFQEFLERHVII